MTLPAGSNVYGADFPPSQYDQDWTLISGITTTTFIAGTPEVAVSAVAPPSGKVLVCIGCGTQNNAVSTERTVVSFQTFEDSPDGALVTAADDDFGVKSNGNSVNQQFPQYHGNMDLVTDLTPGRMYYFQVVYRSLAGAGTAGVSSRSIMVIPVP